MDEKKPMHHSPHDGVERATFRMPTPVEELRAPKPEYWKAERVASAIKDEGKTIEQYMELLGCLDPQADAGTIKAINEIVAEEKKHIEILNKILAAYDCICPEKDGMPGGHPHH